MSPTIPRPIEPLTDPPLRGVIAWVQLDEIGEPDSNRALIRARASRCRPGPRQRTEEHHPDLSGLGHEFDESMHCGGCGREYLAVCAFRPKCEGA